MSEKNLFDKMSLIDVDYVESAVYSEAPQSIPLTSRKWWKPVVATAAALVLGVCCVSFSPQVRAFAEEFLNGSVLFSDGEKSEGKMEPLHVNDITQEQVLKSYRSVEEVEELLGVTLLHSSKTTDKSSPLVEIFAISHGAYIEITDTHYYLYNREIIQFSEDGHGAVSHTTGEGAYTISYNAAFLTDRDNENNKGLEARYENVNVLDHYTTANGLEATVYSDARGYTAVIFHDNVKYELTMTGGGSVEILEEYLETLS